MNDSLIKTEFPQDPQLYYLNHAAVAPWPTRTRQAVCDFAAENNHIGAERYLQWLSIEEQLRGQLCSLINAPSVDDIALVKNTSEALSFVAQGLSWQRGDNIIISDQEFPSNSIVWEALAEHGVTVKKVDLNSADSPEQALLAAIDEQTRLLSISSVQYASGLKMDLQQLGSYCRQHDILFCVDAIQSVGAMQFDVQAIEADFVMADGHKWMLAPEGLGFFYCRAPLREKLRLREYGWHMVEDPGNYTKTHWSPAKSARRFECGSPNMLAAHALQASLSLLLDVGMAEIESAVLKRSQLLFDLIQDSHNLQLLTSTQDGRYAGIVTFRHEKSASDAVYAYLMQQRVICANRGGGIRFSPHFYTPTGTIETAVSMANTYSN